MSSLLLLLLFLGIAVVIFIIINDVIVITIINVIITVFVFFFFPPLSNVILFISLPHIQALLVIINLHMCDYVGHCVCNCVFTYFT